MKKLTTKLLMSLIAVAFAIVALGTSTYAWFTLGGTTTTGAFEATVQSATGIQISLDDTTYKNTITSAEMKANLYNIYKGNYGIDGKLISEKTAVTDASTINASDFRFEPITTTDGKAFSKISSTGTLTSTTAGYLEFTLYFRATGDGASGAKIELSSETVISATPKAWKPSVSLTYNTEDTLTVGVNETFDASNALKVSFAEGETVNVLYGKEDTSEESNSHGTATADATGLARKYAEAMNYTVPAYSADWSCPDYISDLTSSSLTGTDKVVCTCGTSAVDGFYKGSTVVRIWLDGWDGDCIDAITADTISIAFQFNKYVA